MLAADMACGVDNELIGFMQNLGEPGKLPPRPFLDIGARAWPVNCGTRAAHHGVFSSPSRRRTLRYAG